MVTRVVYSTAQLAPDIALERTRPDFGAVNVSRRINRHTLCCTGVARLFHRIGDERQHRAVDGTPNANTTLTFVARRSNRARLGVGHIQHVVGIYNQPARARELVPHIEQRSLLIKNLNAIIAPVTHEQPAFGVHGQCMWLVEFTGC